MTSHMVHGRKVLMDDSLSTEVRGAFLAYLQERYDDRPGFGPRRDIATAKGCTVHPEHATSSGGLYVCREMVRI